MLDDKHRSHEMSQPGRHNRRQFF